MPDEDNSLKKILVIFPICEALEEDSATFFDSFTKNAMKEIETSYLQMAYDVKILWAGLSCKWADKQRLLRENVHSFYSKIVNFKSWKNFKSDFFFMREALSDRQVIWHAAEAAKKNLSEEHFDFVAIAKTNDIDRKSWIYKDLKHSIEEDGQSYAESYGNPVMTWSYFKDSFKMSRKSIVLRRRDCRC